MVTIPDKINHLLTERGLLKRDLAQALGVSPQTATDICKGRSAVTVPHLRRLIEFFRLRADFWMDEDRLTPGQSDDMRAARNLPGRLSSGVVGRIHDAGDRRL